MVLKELNLILANKEATNPSHCDIQDAVGGGSDSSNTRLVTILEDADFRKLLTTQHMALVIWRVSSMWKIAWLWNLLVSPSGGVCGMPSGVKCSLLTPYVEHTAYCTDRTTHVSAPHTPYLLWRPP